MFSIADMLGKTIATSLAFLAVASANPLESIVPRKDAPKPDLKCAEFDYEKLSLREVGQRNTLVRPNHYRQSRELTQTGLAHVSSAPG